MGSKGIPVEPPPEPPVNPMDEGIIPPEIIKACRGRLSQRCRDILDDADRGLSMEEIAKKYGYSDDRSAKQTKYRCWADFVNCVKEQLSKEI